MTTEKSDKANKQPKAAADKPKTHPTAAEAPLAGPAGGGKGPLVHDADAVAQQGDDNNSDGEFSFKRSLKLLIALPIGIVLGWVVVTTTGGLGYEAKEARQEAASLEAKADKVDPVAEEARLVASETAQRVATRVSTEVATRVARDVASRVARDTALQAIENVQ